MSLMMSKDTLNNLKILLTLHKILINLTLITAVATTAHEHFPRTERIFCWIIFRTTDTGCQFWKIINIWLETRLDIT